MQRSEIRGILFMCHSFIMIPSPDYGLAAFIRATGLVLRVFACSELRYPQAQQHGQRPPRRAKNILIINYL
jgi:hypothetical protein